MAEEPEQAQSRAFRLQAMPGVASGRALLVSMLTLIACDVIGGFIGVASGAETWGGAWGFNTRSTVPLPVGAAQLVLAWLATRARPRAALLAAAALSAVCLISVLAGLFDGDLIGNVAADGFFSWGVGWAGVLLAATVAVGVLATSRARQLHRGRWDA